MRRRRVFLEVLGEGFPHELEAKRRRPGSRGTDIDPHAPDREKMQMPHGAGNVHGHVDEQESPRPNQHVKASFAVLNYRATRRREIRWLTRQRMG